MPARCFEMALHANLHLPVAREPCRVDDGIANRLGAYTAPASSFDVSAPRAVATLAIDSLRENRRKDGKLLFVVSGSLVSLGIAVVTKQAFGGNGAMDVLLIAPIVARAHGPRAGALAVPAHREFYELALRCPVKKGSRMIAGADNVIDLLLHGVCFVPVESDSVTAFEKLSVMLNHRVRESGEFVVESIILRVLSDEVLRRRMGKRSTHARLSVGGRDIAVAARAD